MLRKASNGQLFLSQQVCTFPAAIFLCEYKSAFQWRKEHFHFTEQMTLKKKGKNIIICLHLFLRAICQASSLCCLHSSPNIALPNALCKAQDCWRIQNQRPVGIYFSNLFTASSKIFSEHNKKSRPLKLFSLQPLFSDMPPNLSHQDLGHFARILSREGRMPHELDVKRRMTML